MVKVPDIVNAAGGVHTTVLLFDATLSHFPVSIAFTVTTAFVNNFFPVAVKPEIVQEPFTAVVVVAPSIIAPSWYNCMVVPVAKPLLVPVMLASPSVIGSEVNTSVVNVVCSLTSIDCIEKSLIVSPVFCTLAKINLPVLITASVVIDQLPFTATVIVASPVVAKADDFVPPNVSAVYKVMVPPISLEVPEIVVTEFNGAQYVPVTIGVDDCTTGLVTVISAERAAQLRPVSTLSNFNLSPAVKVKLEISNE